MAKTVELKKQRPKPRKSRKKPVKPQPEPVVTALQVIHQKRKPGRNIKTIKTRRIFLLAYEETGGNITASCEFAGISRETYYRWMSSATPINIKFQKQVEKTRAQEVIVDLAHTALRTRILAGDTTAILFTLKTLGKKRGFTELKNEPKQEEQHESEISLIKQKIQQRAVVRGVSFHEELDLYLSLFPNIRADVRNELTEFVN